MTECVAADSSNTEANRALESTRIAHVRTWLASQFDAAGKDVPHFEYTTRSVADLHAIATASVARTKAAGIIAADLRQKSFEYRSQAARIREILESAGLSPASLSPSATSYSHILANTANLLNIRDIEMSSFLVAMGDIFFRKTAVEEERTKVQRESKLLLEYTRNALARLTDLKKILVQLEDEVTARESQMWQWQKNLTLMASKGKQYMEQESQYKVLLERAGYTPEISHGVLMEMAEHRKNLEKKTKPILDTLRCYQDLPPDKALATLAIEDKRRQYAAAEKYLEVVLQSALSTTK